MPNDATNSDGPTPADLVAVYKETWLNVRETDNISLKLIGLVPTVATTAAGVLGFLLHDRVLPIRATIVLSATGALATLGIFLWERRNIETCRWLIRRLGQLEVALKLTLELPPLAPTTFGMRVGKGVAEQIIYTASILVWLVPIAVVLWPQ